MPDRDETLLPVPAWTAVLEQLSLPVRSYQQQLIRTYEPVLRAGEQVLQAYGGWMRYWERFVYWERLVAIEGSAFDVSDWEVEEGTSAGSAPTVPTERRPALNLRGSRFGGQLSEGGKTARSDAARKAMKASLPAGTERVLADLAGVLEVVRTQLEHVTSSFHMLDEQLGLLGTVVSQCQEGTHGQEKQAEG